MTSLQFCHVRPPYQAPDLWVEVNLDVGPGWTALVGPNGSGKTTLLHLGCGLIAPSQGRIVVSGPRLLVPQIPSTPPGTSSGPWEWPEGARWAALLGVKDDWWSRWNTLSSGERQRGLLAWCLAQSPAVLALDEPTNHLDEPAKNLVLEALKRFEGLGLVASHDEEVLGALADRVIWLESSGPWIEQGRWSVIRGEQKRRTEEEATHRALQKKETDRREREGARRRQEAHQAEATKNTKRGLDPKDHDGRARVSQARVSGKDGVQAHRAALWRRQEEAARTEDQRTGPVKRGMRVETAPHGPRSWSDLKLVPGQRVVLTGPNGVGKSTWLRWQVGEPDPLVGYLPQETSSEEGLSLVRRLVEASEEDHDEWLRRAARWGLDPVKVLQTPHPSPGEVQKLRLAALGLRPRAVLALDEPTNHLDLDAKAQLAETLRNFGGTLLVISHDRGWWTGLGCQELEFTKRLSDRSLGS